MVAALVLAGALVANAAVFVYYPVSVTMQPTKPDIVLVPGTNANQTDLAGNVISVIIPGFLNNANGNQTTATIVIHPTLQYNYYHDIIRIRNNGNITYFVNIYINSTNVTAAFPLAYIVIDGVKYTIPPAGNFISINNIQILSGQELIVGFLLYAPDNQPFPQNPNTTQILPVTLDLMVVYSPTNTDFQPLP